MRQQLGDLQLLEWLLAIVVASVVTFAVRAAGRQTRLA
jgi:hypothetical protein